MSVGNGNGQTKVKFIQQVTTGNVLSILTMIVVGTAAFIGVQKGSEALAQRVDRVEKQIERGDNRDEESTRAINDVRGAIIELRGELRSQGRSLERIEKLLEQQNKRPQ